MIDWGLVAGIAGGIVLIGNVGGVIYKWVAPALRIKRTVEELERRSVKDYEAIKKIEQSMEKSEKLDRLQLSAMMDMMNHMIDNNNVEEMKKTRKKIQDMLAEPDQ